VSGVLLGGNDALESDPNIAVSDPYGEGWIAEMEASDWDGESSELASGSAAVTAYQEKLDADGFSCE
jgi:glycine cleavage system H protein